MKSLFIALSLLASSSLASGPLRMCDEAYKKIYRDDELNISIFLGYSDSNDDGVTDNYDKMNFTQMLRKPCSEVLDEQLCSFTRDEDDANIFTKTISRADGTTDKIKIRIMSSAYTESHNQNTTYNKIDQDKKSKKISEAFLKSLQEDEVVFYNGHARRGTGPGFKPMNNTDWAEAVALKPSLNAMSKALKEAKTKPALIGMITCEGEEHYGKALQDSAPDSALLLTRQTTSFSDSAVIMNNSIASLLKKDCSAKFREGIKGAVNNIYISSIEEPKTVEDRLPEIYGLFEPNTKKFTAPRGAIMTLVNDQFESHSTRQEAEEAEKQQKLNESARDISR